MAKSNYATDGTLGVKIADTQGPAETTASFRLGTVVRAADNQVLIYVHANEILASGTAVALGASFTASASAGQSLSTLYAFASGEFGWVVRTSAETVNS